MRISQPPIELEGTLQYRPLSAALRQTLASAKNPQKTFNLYLNNKLWLDALTLTLEQRSL